MYCYQCVAGPDLMRVEIEDGVATRIESNYDITEKHPGGGRVCVKAYGLIQKTYNPNRVMSPMKRTNPLKGRDEDPGFEAISWKEALDTVAQRMRDIRSRGLTDESGFPRLAVSFGGGGTPTQYMGTFPAFLSAWGPIDMGFGGGQGVKCYHSEHLYGELWHRAFIVSPDTPYCNYVINCGNNVEASGGVAGVWRQADARVRGLKRVQVEPHLSITGALSAEWIPIKPKTDAAFLFGLINRMLCERDWRETCDVKHLQEGTTSPYLVGPNGYYLRDPESRKPLIFDLSDKRAKSWDQDFEDIALDGAHIVSGVEEGPDGWVWEHQKISVKTAFQLLLEHMAAFDPVWAEEECDVSAEKIRQIADEYVAHACIGETIEIEGVEMPFRPVAVMLGKGVNNGWGGYQTCWARTLLACLVGALEVPGGTLGTAVKLNRPADNRLNTVRPTRDGVMDYPFNETTKDQWSSDPHIRNAYKTLVPLAADSAWSPALGPAHLPWLFQKKQPKNWPKQTKPEMWINYRTNPAISSWNAPEVAERIAEFPYTVSFAYTRDETNHMADIILPDCTDLESLQLIQIGSTKFTEQYWKHQGWAIRQPVVTPQVDAMDLTDIATELAERVGVLDSYNVAINRGAAGARLVGRDNEYDYGIDTEIPNSREVIWNAVCKAASHTLTDGSEVRDLDWFRENGFMLKPFPQLQWYLYHKVKKEKLRFEMPYQERIKRHGAQLAARLHEIGIDWWEKQLDEYQPFPVYERFPDIWSDHVREAGKDPKDFPFFALTARSMQYSWGANVGIPLINEVANNIAGHRGVIINRTRAFEMGLREGDRVEIQSVAGITRGKAVLREGIRPDTILMIGQFDHWATPYAKDLDLPSLNSVTSLSLSLTDATGSSADLARVSIRKADSERTIA